MREVHGRRYTREYVAWSNMKTRCTNEANDNFKFYGARGIEVCARWLLFSNFYADMGECPPGLTLERIENDKGYEPGNCRWATRKEQGRNRRSNRLITCGGVTKLLIEWAEDMGLTKGALIQRMRRGSWP